MRYQPHSTDEIDRAAGDLLALLRRAHAWLDAHNYPPRHTVAVEVEETSAGTCYRTTCPEQEKGQVA